MKCLNPISIKHPVLWENVDLDYEKRYIKVPCGKCMQCRIERKREWKVRLMLESTYYKENSFVTLTYNDDNISNSYSLVRKDLQDFIKRYRYYEPKKFKYYAVGEYGEETGRPHYHLIMLGTRNEEALTKAWTKGFTEIGPVNPITIQYVTGYVTKKLYGDMAEQYGGRVPPFVNCSQGIGLSYLKQFEEQIRKDMHINILGYDYGLPRYFKKKLGLDRLDYQDMINEKKKEEFKRLRERVSKDMDAFTHDIAWFKQFHPDNEEMLLDYLTYVEKERTLKQNEKNLKAKLSLNKGKI